MSVVSLGSAFVHYEVLGRGRPVIFIHGWVGSWRYWIPAMQVSSTMYRAYAIDLWGFGETQHDHSQYSFEKQLALLDEFLDKQGIGKIALVGHGLGGLLSMAFASSRPQNVDRLMVISSPLDEQAVNARLKSASPIELADWLLSRNIDSESVRQDVVKTDPAAIAASLENLTNGFFTGITSLRTPCLLVYGQNDPAISMPPAEYISRMSYNTHQIVLETSGHFPMLDEASKFNRLMTDFFSLDTGISPRELQLKEEWKRRVR